MNNSDTALIKTLDEVAANYYGPNADLIHLARTRLRELLDTGAGDDAKILTALDPRRRFTLNDPVQKTKGSSWRGRVVGFYSTTLTPIGYAIESFSEKGSVQLYPEAALEAIPVIAPINDDQIAISLARLEAYLTDLPHPPTTNEADSAGNNKFASDEFISATKLAILRIHELNNQSQSYANNFKILIETADYYIQQLKNVLAHKVVRDLAEAEAGFEHSKHTLSLLQENLIKP